jgi:carboxyl-terminal processing protease
MLRALLFFLSLTSLIFSKPPAITQADAKNKIQEILRSHACHHRLDTELIKRSFSNMIDELDPLKLYFLSNEIETYLEPSEELLQKTLDDYHKGIFTEYLKLHALMEKAIDRRVKLETSVSPSQDKVSSRNFKDIKFSDSEDVLFDRLCQVRSLHEQTLTKLKEDPQKFLNKINKRRTSHELELLGGKSSKEKEEMALTIAIKSLVSSLDSQTHYFTPKEANQFLIQIQQRLFGIGAQLRDDVNGLGVMKIIEGSPAFKQGDLKVGDTIIAVDRQTVTGMDISEAVELIRGPEGSKVRLTVMNDKEETQDIEITRGEIVIQETRLDKSIEPYGDGVVAIFHLFTFYQDEKTSSMQDIANGIAEIQKEHKLKGVILDLRYNAGGHLSQAVSVAGLFIKPGVVVSVKDNTGFVSHLRSLEKTPKWNGPLLVMINKASASAAEIVAQTLQDYGRALVIGDDTSYGKGTFQTFTLDSSGQAKVNPKGEYKVTRGLYYTVSGKSPQLNGVKSDITVHGPLAFSDIGEKNSKHPLQPDEIMDNFDDRMDDVSLFQRLQLERIYENSKQNKIQMDPYLLQVLTSNSDTRLKQNKSYQEFISEIQKEEPDQEALEKINHQDYQLQEAIDLLKDLIFLEKTQSQAA